MIGIYIFGTAFPGVERIVNRLDTKKRSDSLRASFFDGVFASGMTGLTQDYFTPFLLLLGGGVREVGLLSSLPNIVGSLAQLATFDIMRRLKSRKKTITVFVFLQALALLCIAVMAYAGAASLVLCIALVTVFTALGAVATPAWGSLMSDLVPEGKRGAYFGWRNSVLGVVIVAFSLSAGSILHSMEGDAVRMGFFAIFGLAFAFRLGSWYNLKKMYDPDVRHAPAPAVRVKAFLGALKGSNFARFLLFISLMSFTVNLAAPYFAVLMLKDLGFGYFKYTIVTITATFIMYVLMNRWGRFSDAIGNLRVLKFTAPIIAIIPLLWIVSRNPFFLVFAQIVSGFAWAGFNLCATNYIYDAVAPEKRVRYISYFNVLNGLSLSAGALAGGLLVAYLPPLMGYKILTLFAVSSALRLIVCAAVPFSLREVRSVQSVNSRDLFFSMIGFRPLLGVDRKTIRY